MKKKILISVFFITLILQLIFIQPSIYAIETNEKIEEGIYKIVLANLPDKSITIDWGSNANGANVCIQEYSNTVQQLFKIKYDNEGYCEIIPVNSGKRIDIAGWGNGVNIEQWGENPTSDSQKFTIVKNEKGNYNIIGKRQNLYLTANDINQGSIINLIGYEKNDKKVQEFKLEKIETPTEGRYKIVLASSRTQSVSVKDGKIDNGIGVCLKGYGNTVKQQYEIKYDGEGYCEIIPVHSEKRLDVAGWGAGARIEQWTENKASDSQKFTIIKNENGNFNIIAKRQNLYLTVNNSNIEGHWKNWASNQEFYLEKIENQKTLEEGTYKITAANNRNQSITIAGGSSNNGANVHIWEYGNALQQEFNLVYDGNGYYEIIAVNSGKRLDAAGWGNGVNIEQWSKNTSTDSQKWMIYKNEKGNYNIICKRQNIYLTVHDSNFSNGTNLEGYQKNYSSGQEFKIEKIVTKSEKLIDDGTYKMTMKTNNNMVVEAAGGNWDNCGRLQIWQDFDARWQKVRLTYENGYYKIELNHSNKSLTVKYNNSSIGSEVMQYDYNWGENQKWVIRDNGDGSMSIYPLSNWTYALNVNNNIQNGSVLNLNYNTQDNTEKFNFVRYYDRYAEEGTYGWSGLKVQGNGNGGEYLRFYKVGNGNKKLFLNFSIHGFEDSYDHDGSELTYIADQFYSYMKQNMPIDLINQWTIYIFPMSNPDGQRNGWTNNGPGRTTLYSWANGNKGIDMNRCFPVNYKSTTNSSRNYNGTQPLQAFEAENLRNFVLSHTGSKNIVIDVHGWLNETIGDDGLGWYYRNQFGINKHIGTYGSGYFIQWARTLANTRSMLLELPEVQNHNQVVQWDYSNKFINATIQLLRDN